MRGRFSFKAIIVGFIVDVVTTAILATLITTVAAATTFAALVPAPGSPAATNAMATNTAAMTAQITALMNSPLMIVGSIFSGALGSLLGGYVSGVLAPGAEVKNAAAMGALGLALGLLMLLASPAAVTAATSPPMWVTLVSFLLTIPAAACGGALRALKTAPDNARATDQFRQ